MQIVAAQFRLDGVDGLIVKLRELDERICKQALRRAITQASKPVLTTAKSLVPRDTGSLRKALGRVIKSYRKGHTVVGIVGARRDASPKEIQRRKVQKKKIPKAKFRRLAIRKNRKTAMMVNPGKYAARVEFGRHAVRPTKKQVMSDTENIYGRYAKAVGPRPFLRPALDNNRGVVRDIVKAVFREALMAVRK